MKTSKPIKKISNTIFIVILIVCCAGIGFLIGSASSAMISGDAELPEFIVLLLIQLLLLFTAYFLQLILHEGGHLIAGLITGYRFSSFRIGSLMLLKNHEGISFRRFSLPGTGGQCLLIPPERQADGSYPYKLYHLGGILMNLITALLFFSLYQFLPGEGHPFLLYLAITGAITAITNGIPVLISGTATDGYNVLHAGKQTYALDALWIQLKINEAQTEGIRLRDLPEEWFRIPDSADKGNVLLSTIAVMAENRAMDALDFGKAKKLISRLSTDGEYSILGLYNSILAFDKLTLDLIEKRENADLSLLNNRQTKALRKSMARFPAVIRTEYAIQLLKEKDRKKAQKYRELLRSVAKRYPMPSDIASETEIMDYIDSLP